MKEEIRIVFDGPPSHESGRFVEVEDANGRSISVGNWHERTDGLWELRIPSVDIVRTSAGTNTGHGHVWERPDGMKARCGGPGMCAECSRDAATYRKRDEQ